MEKLVLRYPEVRALQRELKATGMRNFLAHRRLSLTGKDRFKKMLEQYERFRVAEKISATFEIIYGMGWGSSVSSQQKKAEGDVFIPVENIGGRRKKSF